MGEVEVSQSGAPSGVEPWSPFTEFERMRRGLDEMLTKWPGPMWPGLGAEFMPPADVEELDDAWVVELELPGVDRADIDVQVANRTLVVTGERKEKERKGILRHKKRVTGTFRYEVTVPADIDADGVSASLVDGELTVRLPKIAAERPRRIAIT